MVFRLLTKEQMVEQFRRLRDQGWIMSHRPLSHGGIGNTMDNLLGLPENNLPIADSAQWELKTHRIGSSSLITLFHMEPLPKRIVPNLLLPNYGWPDQKGRPDELSFRQTLRATQFTDRGFRIAAVPQSKRVTVIFDPTQVASHHSDWLRSVEQRIGLGPLHPEPYWNIQDLALKASTKMLNSFFVEVETTKAKGEEFFRILSIRILQGFDTDGFIVAIDQGGIFVDFDARTHHNHGTKYRLREDFFPTLYRYVDVAS